MEHSVKELNQSHTSEITYLFSKRVSDIGMAVESNVSQTNAKTSSVLEVYQTEEDQKNGNPLCKLTHLHNTIWKIQDNNIGLNGIDNAELSQLTIIKILETVKYVAKFKVA